MQNGTCLTFFCSLIFGIYMKQIELIKVVSSWLIFITDLFQAILFLNNLSAPLPILFLFIPYSYSFSSQNPAYASVLVQFSLYFCMCVLLLLCIPIRTHGYYWMDTSFFPLFLTKPSVWGTYLFLHVYPIRCLVALICSVCHLYLWGWIFFHVFVFSLFTPYQVLKGFQNMWR